MEERGPMKVGVGLEEDTVALYAAGANYIIAPSETHLLRKMHAFRSYDTIVIVRPTLLREQSYQELVEASDGEGHFEVVGHEAVQLKNADAIKEFRKVKAVVSKSIPVAEAKGRRPKIVYSIEQAEAILKVYFEEPRLSPERVADKAEEILDLEPGTISKKVPNDPAKWVKDLCRKYLGTTRRDPPAGWDGIQLDADGKNVRYWE